MPAERRKPRPRPKTRTLVAGATDAPESQAQLETSSSQHTSRQNLKLSEWLAVFAYIDAHPTLSQQEVVKHFAALKSGALVFTQPTLSRKLQERSDLEQRAHDNPSALDSKRPRVVTRPDVERALFLWVRHMEAKGEQVNGPMLKAKRRTFEELFNVPEEERLPGDGWLKSFCRAYKIQEHTAAAAAAIETATNRTGLEICTPARPAIPQLTTIETEVSKSISELQAQNRVFGTPPTLDEFLEPKEDAECLDSMAVIFEGGDEAIVAKVVQEMAEQNSEVINVDFDDDDEPGTPDISRSEAISLCERLAEACLQHGDASSDLAIGLLTHLHRFRVFLRREELTHAQQTFTPQSRQSSEPSS